MQARDKAILHLTRLQEVHAVVNRHPGANLRQVSFTPSPPPPPAPTLSSLPLHTPMQTLHICLSEPSS